ncbi:Sugar transporter SWEET1 [Frankliniella fusca]|uniref:Sugar transporter SWEET n=1 Tax=Frankliniella fusca TaxID=407009 RepID=A0AAE1LCK2_9NEOP|nr:Sugar transporter SWEET1 [Frankliniella fusca]
MTLEALKESLASCASLCTVLLFMTGMFTASKILKRKTVGEDSYAPFITGFLSCSLWLRYGTLIEDPTITLVNTVGVFLHFSYLSVYIFHSKSQLGIVKQLTPSILCLLIVLFYTFCLEENIDVVKFYVGLIASAITIAFFAAPMTKLMHVIRCRSVECLPFPMIAASFIVSAQWLLYGFILNDPFITVPNSLGCFLSFVQLTLFFIYPSTPDGIRREFSLAPAP